MRAIIFLFMIGLLVASPVTAQEWCGVNNLYFQDAPSGVDGFHILAMSASGNNITDENITISSASGLVLVDSYISPQNKPGTGVELLAGLRQYNLYDYVSSVSQPSYFTINVSKYNMATNRESFYYNITSTAISGVTPSLDRTFYVAGSNVTFGSNDRLLIRIYAYTTRNTATTIHFLNQGNDPTYIQSGFFLCPPAQTPTSPSLAIALGVVGGLFGALALLVRNRNT